MKRAWRYLPRSPELLTPARRVQFAKRPPPAVSAAVAHFRDLEEFGRRRHAPIAMRSQRKRPAGWGRGSGRVVVQVPPAQETRQPREDWWCFLHRAAQVVAEHAEVGKRGLAGEWRGNKFIRFLKGSEWAALVGCTAATWSRIVGRWKNAGWIKERRQRRERECIHGTPACEGCRATGRYTWVARTASLNVTDAFWQAARGAWPLVLKHRAKVAAREARAADPREHPPRAPEPAQPAADEPDGWGWWKQQKPPPTR